MEMQVMLFLIERLRAKDFAIDMLFEYEEDDGSTLMWCQGMVVISLESQTTSMCLLRLNGVISV